MNLLGFVQAQTPAPAGAVPSDLSFQLHVYDVLASTHRLWVRGRLIGLHASLRQFRRQAAMMIPVPMIELYESHSTLG